MEHYQVRYFLALARELNFTRAAEASNVTQPTLTRAIHKLEDELGGLLFHRSKTKTVLSDFGRLMLPYLERIAETFSEAKHTAEDFTNLRKASLKLGVMCTISPDRLVDILRDFRSDNPGVEIELLDGTSEEIGKSMLDGNLDVGIYCSPAEEPDSLHTMPLFRERFVVVTGKEHRFRELNSVSMAELHGERYVARINCEYAEFMDDLWREEDIKVVRAHSSERDDWILRLIGAGLGFGLFPEYSAFSPDLVVRPLVEPEIARTVNLMTMRGRRHSPTVGAFLMAVNKHRRLWREAA